MEVIDLDKVLDDFELSEGNCSPVIPGKEVTPSGLQQYVEQEDGTQNLTITEDAGNTRLVLDQQTNQKLAGGIYYDIPYNPIDISEADFRPAVPRNPNLIVQEIEASKVLNASLSESTSEVTEDQLPSVHADGSSDTVTSGVRADVLNNGVSLQDSAGLNTSLSLADESVKNQAEPGNSHVNGDASSSGNKSLPVDSELSKTEVSVSETISDIAAELPAAADEDMPALVNVSESKTLEVSAQADERHDEGSLAASSDMRSDSEVSMSLSEVPSLASGQSDNTQASVSPEMSAETSPAHATVESDPAEATDVLASSPGHTMTRPVSLGLTPAVDTLQPITDLSNQTLNSCDSSITDRSLPSQPIVTDTNTEKLRSGSNEPQPDTNIEKLQSGSNEPQPEEKVVGFGSDDEDLEDGDMEAYFSDMIADNHTLSQHSFGCQAAKITEAIAPPPETLHGLHCGGVPDTATHVEHGAVSTDNAESHGSDSNAHGDVHDAPKASVTEPAEEINCDDKMVLACSQNPGDGVDVSKDTQEEPSRDESCESVEKFLTIPVASPIVATPMEETGFSKVPGYMPDAALSALEEEPSPSVEECPPSAEESGSFAFASSSFDSAVESTPMQTDDSVPADPDYSVTTDTKESRPISLTFAPVEKENTPPFGASGPSSLDSDPGKAMTGIGARPKDPNFAKKNRPNTLLGLSKPDLNLAPAVSQEPEPMIVDCATETSNGNSHPQEEYENSHDVINRQLAQNKRSPLRKKQLNLEIQQQLNEERALDEHRLIDNKMMEAEALIQGDIPVERYRRKEQSPAQGESEGPAFQAGVEPSLSLPPPTSFEAGKQKRPNSLDIIPTSALSPFDEDNSPSDDPGSASSAGHTPYMPQESSVSSGFGPSGLETGPGAFSPPLSSANMNVSITQLGKVAPHWVPDADAPNCMECAARFTFTKRRHHCRACGKVFCSACCNLKCKLYYMDNKEARVCSKCYQDIVRAQAYERLHSPTGLAGPDAEGGSGSGNRSPNPNNPSEYCSTVPPLQQAQASLHAPPPTVMVPVGVLRKEGNSHEFESSTSTSGPKVEQGSQRNKEPKQVMFSDGIRPGGDLTELDGSSQPRTLMRKSGRSARKVERGLAAEEKSSGNSSTGNSKAGAKTKKIAEAQKSVCLIPDKGLPPVILSTGVKGDYSVEENPDPEKILPQIMSSDANPVVFAINKNLFVLVKIVNLSCCVNRTCWCFTTQGMCTVGQDEMVIVLECLPDEKTIPRDIFCHFNSVYEEAGKGNTVSHLGHTIFGQSFLESKDHCGFLYIRPSFQCLQKLSLPPAPYIFGILLQRWETPWAKVFPLRLMLRLGAEFRYYPCPLISVRFRKPVYGEIGHTIMNLLADFTNFQYMLPQIKGVVIHMEDKKTFINFPKNKYEEVMKVINNSNDHVMALGSNFSMEADSHLVCIQNEEGNYQTQAINIQNKTRKVTGSSFVVFNGALKLSSGLRGKSSIVEDGLMVQITSESMASLKQALRDMKDYTIGCGTLDSVQPEEQVFVQWIEEDRNINMGVKSPIDSMRMDGIESVHIHLATDYVGENRRIRWTEVFFIENDEPGNTRCEPVDLSRLADTLAKATCVALTGQLDKLKEAGLTRIGLRATIDAEKVGYEVGAGGEKLPDFYMNDLDNELIPVIHNAANNSQNGSVVLELIFHIIE